MLPKGPMAAPARQLDTDGSVSAQNPKVLLIAAWLGVHSSIYTQYSTMQSLLSTPGGRFAKVLSPDTTLALIDLLYAVSGCEIFLGFVLNSGRGFLYCHNMGVLKPSERCCMKTASS